MNAVKREEEPTPLGFSHTRLGMERSREKMGLVNGAMAGAARKEAERH
jgi:hypothetical protein